MNQADYMVCDLIKLFGVKCMLIYICVVGKSIDKNASKPEGRSYSIFSWSKLAETEMRPIATKITFDSNMGVVIM